MTLAAENTNLFPALASEKFVRIKADLARLAQSPPQVLLLEGASEEERQQLARYWACCCNCQNQVSADPGGYGNRFHGLTLPCLGCQTCGLFASGEHLDFFALDGRISNREDTESPGLVRAFNMERVRELKSRLADAPHGPGRRVVILAGIGNKRDEAANALLKSLEEPSATTVFVLLAPQREQLLPTLVSRSFCLTLPWSPPEAARPDLAPWLAGLAAFLRNGQGFLDKAGAKGAMALDQAEGILQALGQSMARVLAGRRLQAGPEVALDSCLAKMDLASLANLGSWLTEARQMLALGVTPARVVEALSTRIFVRIHKL